MISNDTMPGSGRVRTVETLLDTGGDILTEEKETERDREG